MTATLYATFSDWRKAGRAAGALLDNGARPEDLSVIRRADEAPVDNGSSDRGDPNGSIPANKLDTHEGAANYSRAELRSPNDWCEDAALEEQARSGITLTTPADAEAGAVKGAGVGIGVGAVAALASLFIPGIGLVAGGGALAIALTGLAGTMGAGAIAGAITGYLKDQGMDWQAAQDLGTAVSGVGALLSIEVPSGSVDESTVRSILNKYGAVSVTDLLEKRQRGYLA